MMRLKENIAVVTGAGRGIGREISLHLAAEGSTIACVDLRSDAAEETAEAICQTHGKSRGKAYAVDISRREEAHGLIRSVHADLGGVDTIVNNAMWMRYQPLADADESALNRMFAVGVGALVWTAQAAAPSMAARGGGAIINISSAAAFRATPNSAAYCAVKGAVVSLTRQLALDLGPSGIRVNAIAPGFIATPIAVRNVGSEKVDARIKTTPLGRAGQPSDIAAAVAFLAGADSRFISGQTLVVDGGRLATAMLD